MGAHLKICIPQLWWECEDENYPSRAWWRDFNEIPHTVKPRMEETFSPRPHTPKASENGSAVRKRISASWKYCEKRGNVRFTVPTAQCFAATKDPKYLGEPADLVDTRHVVAMKGSGLSQDSPWGNGLSPWATVFGGISLFLFKMPRPQISKGAHQHSRNLDHSTQSLLTLSKQFMIFQDFKHSLP